MTFSVYITSSVGLLLSAIAFIITLFLIIVFVIKAKLLQNAANIMILSYMLLDLVAISLYFLPVFLMSLYSNWYTCNMLFPFAYALGVISCLHLSTITLWRLLAIEQPFLYQRFATPRNTTIIMILVWILPLGVYIAAFTDRYSTIQSIPNQNTTKCIRFLNFQFGQNISSNISDLRSNVEIYYFIIAIVPVCIIVVCYARIDCILFKICLRISTENQALPVRRSIKKQNRVLRQMAVLTLIFITSYPAAGIVTSIALRHSNIVVVWIIFLIGTILQLIYSITMPLFYMKYTSDIKKEVTKILWKKRLRQVGIISSRSNTTVNSESTQRISIFTVSVRRNKLPNIEV